MERYAVLVLLFNLLLFTALESINVSVIKITEIPQFGLCKFEVQDKPCVNGSCSYGYECDTSCPQGIACCCRFCGLQEGEHILCPSNCPTKGTPQGCVVCDDCTM